MNQAKALPLTGSLGSFPDINKYASVLENRTTPFSNPSYQRNYIRSFPLLPNPYAPSETVAHIEALWETHANHLSIQSRPDETFFRCDTGGGGNGVLLDPAPFLPAFFPMLPWTYSIPFCDRASNTYCSISPHSITRVLHATFIERSRHRVQHCTTPEKRIIGISNYTFPARPVTNRWPADRNNRRLKVAHRGREGKGTVITFGFVPETVGSKKDATKDKERQHHRPFDDTIDAAVRIACASTGSGHSSPLRRHLGSLRRHGWGVVNRTHPGVYLG